VNNEGTFRIAFWALLGLHGAIASEPRESNRPDSFPSGLHQPTTEKEILTYATRASRLPEPKFRS
jgi:hypothetical protein